MNKKDFDKKLKQDLDSYQSPINIDEIWSAIEPDVDLINAKKRRKKRFFFIWFFAGLILLSSAGYLYSLYQLENQSPIAKEHSKKEVPLASIKKTEVAVDAETDQITKLSEAAILPNTSNLNSKKENKNTPSLNSQELLKQEIDNASSNSVSNNSNQAGEKNIDASFVNSSSIADFDIKLKTTTLSTNTVDNSKVESTERFNDLVEEFKPSKPVETSKKLELEKTTSLSSLDAIEIEAQVENGILNLEDLFVLTEEEKEASTKKKKPSAKKKMQYFIEMNSGVSAAFRSLKDPSGSNANLLQLREEFEHTLEAVHGGFQVGLHFPKSDLAFSTGIQYTQITDYLEINDSRSVFDTIPDGIQFYYRNLDNEIIPYHGEVINEEVITRRKKTYNEFVFIDIPLLVGIQKNVGSSERLGLGVQTGVFVNIALNASGEIINEDSEVEDLSPSFNSKMGVSYYLGLTSAYAFGENKKLSLQLSPSFRYIPKSLTVDSYGLTQKYSLLGVNIGLRLKL